MSYILIHFTRDFLFTPLQHNSLMQTALYHCITKLTFKADCLLFFFVCFQLGVPCHVLAAEGYCLSLGFPSNSAFGKKNRKIYKCKTTVAQQKHFLKAKMLFCLHGFLLLLAIGGTRLLSQVSRIL